MTQKKTVVLGRKFYGHCQTATTSDGVGRRFGAWPVVAEAGEQVQVEMAEHEMRAALAEAEWLSPVTSGRPDDLRMSARLSIARLKVALQS